MDLFGIRIGMLNVATNLEARRARQLHPDRFLASWDVDPNRGMEAIYELEQAVEQLGVKSVQVFPAGPDPAGADQRQEDVSALREVHRARHPDLRQRRRTGPARADGVPGRRA